MNLKAGLTKKQIRSKILLRLRKQKEDLRNQKSNIIRNKLFRAKVFKKAKVVMFYIAFDGEVKTQEMIRAAKKIGKIVTVPVCKEDRITIKPCLLGENDHLRKGPYGVKEPVVERPISIKDLDLVVVPAVAFDKKRNRLGRGKGCYDRFLDRLDPGTASIGLAFDFQILTCLPVQTHDIKVQKVIFA